MKSRTVNNTRKRQCWFNYCIPKPLRIKPRNYQQTFLCSLLFDSSCRPPLLFLEQLITPWWEPFTPAQGKLFSTHLRLFYFSTICTQYFPDSLVMSCWINVSHVCAPVTLLDTFMMISTCNSFFLSIFQLTQQDKTFHRPNKAAWLSTAILAVSRKLNTVDHNSLIVPVQLLTEQQKYKWEKRWLCFWTKLMFTGHLGLQQPTLVQYSLIEDNRHC